LAGRSQKVWGEGNHILRNGTLVVGGSGKVGRLALAAWRDNQRLQQDIVLQSRLNDTITGPKSLRWDPVEGSKPLCDWVDNFGPLRTMVVLAGVIPGQGRDLFKNKVIAEACLDAAIAAGISRVLIASSSAVYGADSRSPFVETSICNPVNAYGTAKIEMEKACLARRRPGLDICILRIGNVAGADMLLLNIAKLTAGQTIEIDVFNDGRGPVRSYIGPETFASTLQSLCTYSDLLPDIINIAAPSPVSMDDLAVAAGCRWTPRIHASSLPQRITLNCNLLASLHDFNPEDSGADEIIRQWRRTIEL